MSGTPDKALPSARLCTALALALVVGIAWAYAGVRAHGFVNYDDPTYVTHNPHVLGGLTLDSVRWGLTSGAASNWHPVTWLSHMLDVELYHLDAGKHHLTSVLIHALNALLLFGFLALATRRAWPAFFAAALFAWHPLRVESVAWIAERKDVLAGFFFFAALLAYARWREARSPKAYAALALCLALGLMSKPMLVTLPFLLVLLDRWPLASGAARPAWRDKLPLLAIVVASALITLGVQSAGGAVAAVDAVPLGLRVANALRSVGVYAWQSVWPTDLACFYPHARNVASDPAAALRIPAIAGALFVACASLGAVLTRKRAPYLCTGWFWFLGMLVPVLGLVQVGSQAHADRYTYLPAVGLAIALAYGISDLVRARPALRVPMLAGALLALGALLAATRAQAGVWRDDRSLYEHALAVTESNHLAHANLGWMHFVARDYDAAATHLSAATRIHAADPAPWLNLGLTLLRSDRLEEARSALEHARALAPHDARVHSNLGEAFFRADDFERAASAYGAAIAARPDFAPDRVQLGFVLLRRGQNGEAVASFEAAAALAPDDPEPQYGLSVAALLRGDDVEARDAAQRALDIAPGHPDALRNLRAANERLGDGQ